MQAPRQLLLIIIALFFYLSSSGQNSAWDRYQQSIRDKAERDRIEGNRILENQKKQSESSEWQKTVAENSKIPTKKYGQMQFYRDVVGIDGGVKTGYLISYKPAGQSQSWFTTYLASWNLNIKAWQIISVNTSPDAKKTSYGVYYGYTVESVSEDNLKPYYYDANKYLSTEEKLAALEDLLSGKKSVAEKKKEEDEKFLKKNIEQEKRKKEETRKKQIQQMSIDIVNAPPHSLVEFIGEKGIQSPAIKLNIWSKDSFFLAHQIIADVWTVDLVSLKGLVKLPYSKYFMSSPALKKKSGAEISTELEENLIDLEKKINKQLKKKSAEVYVAEQKKEELRQQQANLVKIEAEKKNAEQEKLAKFRQMKANRKQVGSLVRNRPFHSIVPFYLSDEKSFLFEYLEGYKLAIPAKDSFFILDRLDNSCGVILIDQTKNPTIDDGYYFKVYSSYEIDPPPGQIANQEDFISAIEKLIVKQIRKQVSKEPIVKVNDDRYIDYRPNWRTVFENVTKSFGTNISYRFGLLENVSNSELAWLSDYYVHVFDILGKNMFKGCYTRQSEKTSLYLGVYKYPDGDYISGLFDTYRLCLRVYQASIGTQTIRYGKKTILFEKDGTISFPDTYDIKGVNIIFNTNSEPKYRIYRNSTVPILDTVAGKYIFRNQDGMFIPENLNTSISTITSLVKYNNGDIYYGRVTNFLPIRTDTTVKPFLRYGNEGILIKANGDVLLGDFNTSASSIFNGMVIYKNGNIYKGMLINDKPEVFGQYLDDAKGEFYEGGFRNGERHGFGKLSVITSDAVNKQKTDSRPVIYTNGILQQ